jgi:Zn-dependent peptidase ImmA (M78 family)
MRREVDLAREALEASLDIRTRAGCELGAAVNVFDVCQALTPQVRVLFTDFSMEGCYIHSDRPLIKVSALRPLVRRVFNCAHELGHHAFGHGSRIDELQEDPAANTHSDPEEFLANAFAGFLLMPKIAVRRACTRRGWKMADLMPAQLYTLACHFGVGYETLISHLEYGLREIGTRQAASLKKVRLPAIRRDLVGSHSAERLMVADPWYELPCVDAEVGTHLLVPAGAVAERQDVVEVAADLAGGRLFVARRPGICRMEGDGGWAVIARVSKYQYAGWSQYRHLELEEGDE